METLYKSQGAFIPVQYRDLLTYAENSQAAIDALNAVGSV